MKRKGIYTRMNSWKRFFIRRTSFAEPKVLLRKSVKWRAEIEILRLRNIISNLFLPLGKVCMWQLLTRHKPGQFFTQTVSNHWHFKETPPQFHTSCFYMQRYDVVKDVKDFKPPLPSLLWSQYLSPEGLTVKCLLHNYFTLQQCSSNPNLPCRV